MTGKAVGFQNGSNVLGEGGRRAGGGNEAARQGANKKHSRENHMDPNPEASHADAAVAARQAACIVPLTLGGRSRTGTRQCLTRTVQHSGIESPPRFAVKQAKGERIRSTRDPIDGESLRFEQAIAASGNLC